MKILSVIVGLALTAGGVYLAYDTFMLFDDLESLRLGLLLGGSFLAMTLGLYLFLLPLAMKPKNKKNKDNVKEVIVDTEPSEAFISETEALHVIQENEVKQETSQDDHLKTYENIEVKPDSVEKDSLDLDKTKAFEVIHESFDTQARHTDLDQTRIMSTLFDEGPHDVDGDTIVLPTFNEEVEASQTDDRLFTAKVFNDTLDFETKHELRVIGIESFGSQRILKKLQPDSELNLSYKQKKGLNLAQITHRDKVIGYVSRLEMNHLNKSLDQLIRVTPGDIVTDGRKVIRFSVQLHFKDEEKQNA